MSLSTCIAPVRGYIRGMMTNGDRAIARRKCKTCERTFTVVSAPDGAWVCPSCAKSYRWLDGVVNVGLDEYFASLSVPNEKEGL